MNSVLRSVYLLLVFTLVFKVSAPECHADQSKQGKKIFLEESLPLNGEPLIPLAVDFTELVNKVSSGVVHITSGPNSELSQESGDEDEEQSPKHPLLPPDGESISASGSGFIISSDGLIVTNNHVVGMGADIKVKLVDVRKNYDAKVIGRDPRTDLALIKIDPDQPLPVLPIGNSDSLKVGEWVVAIGNQFQLGQTVTAGIVSAKARRVNLFSGASSGPYDQFIQTDASINPGSSGGPLMNRYGQVVGINTAIFSPGRGGLGGGAGFNIGIGFAIPSNMAKDVIQELFDKGKVVRGLLGVIIQPVTSEVQEAMGLEEAAGALVPEVLPGSPADKAGFKTRDVIVSFNGKAILDHDELPILVGATKVGEKVEVEVIRRSKKISLSPVLTELIEEDLPGATKEGEELEPDRLGIGASDIPSEIRSSLGLTIGVFVGAVAPNSIAERAGIARGDLLLALDDSEIKDVKQYAEILNGLPDKRYILALVRRKEGTRFLTLKLK